MQKTKNSIVVVTSDIKFSKKIENCISGFEFFRFESISKIEKNLEKLAQNENIFRVVLVETASEAVARDEIPLKRMFYATEEVLADAIWIFVASDPSAGTKMLHQMQKILKKGSEGRWFCLSKTFLEEEWSHWLRFAAEASLKMNRLEKLRRITAVARGLGHEFGNSLFKAGGRAELIGLETEQESIKTHVTAILKAVDQGGQFVNRLHFLPKEGLEPQAVFLREIVDDALRAVVRAADPSSQITVDVQVNPGLRLRADSKALSQALQELLSNAMQAIPQEGTIKLIATQDGGRVVLRIQDTGCGMSEDVLSRIFDWGYHTRGEKGGGLGLSMAREIMEAHGGTLHAESVPGQGSSFILVFTDSA